MRCQQFPKHLISVACSFFWMSTINDQVSQAYKSAETIREPMSLIFELREIFLSFQITQMVFSFDRAAVIGAILDSTLGLEP